MLEVCHVRSYFLKTNNDRTHKSDANTLSWHMVNASLTNILIQFKSLVLDTQRPCASSNPFLEENNLPPIIYGFFHKVISMHDVRHMLGIFKCSSTAGITLRSCTGELSPDNDTDPELNRQFPFSIDLHKILPVVRTKARKSNIDFSKHTGA